MSSLFLTCPLLICALILALVNSFANGLTSCKDANIIFTGLPAYHPLVAQLGFDPKMVDASLKQGIIDITKAGYNLRSVYFGPEKPIEVFAKRFGDIKWAGAGIGFGVRGAARLDTTKEFEETIKLFRHKVPFAPIFFNYSPNSTLEALQRRVPLPPNCPPGKDLGTFTECDICG